MIFRATKDGFKAENFHGSCDGKGKTVALIKTEAKDGGHIRISGWYTDINWTSPENEWGELKSG